MACSTLLPTLLPGEPVYEAQRYRSVDEDESLVPGVGAKHLDGVPWYEAPVPSRRHACWVQTLTWLHMDRQHRCACGAMRNGFFDPWKARNARLGDQERRRHDPLAPHR